MKGWGGDGWLGKKGFPKSFAQQGGQKKRANRENSDLGGGETLNRKRGQAPSRRDQRGKDRNS